MSRYITDTMAFILVLENRKMPRKIKSIYEDTFNHKAKIYVPSIVFAELSYLSEKKRIDTNLMEVKAFLKNNTSIIELALTLKSVETAFQISDIPELHYRLLPKLSDSLSR